MRVKIVMPLTDGPAHVARIASMPRLAVSHAVEADSVGQLDPISERYDYLVRAGGPIDVALKTARTRWKLTLSRRPTSGESWQLPVAVAHWALTRGHEIVEDAPDLVVWSTGRMDSDGRLVPDEYELPRKLDKAGPQRTAPAGTRVLVLLPPKAAGIAHEALGEARRTDIHTVDSLRSAFAVLDEATRHEAPFPLRRVAAALAVVALLSGGGWAITRAGNAEDTTTDPAVGSTTEAAQAGTDAEVETPAAGDGAVDEPRSGGTGAAAAMPSLVLVEHRAPEGRSCVAVVTDSDSLEVVARPALEGSLPATDLSRTCAISFRLEPPGAGAVALPPALVDALTPSSRAPSVAVSAEGSARLTFLRFAEPTGPYAITLTSPGGDAAGYTHALIDNDDS